MWLDVWALIIFNITLNRIYNDMDYLWLKEIVLLRTINVI